MRMWCPLLSGLALAPLLFVGAVWSRPLLPACGELLLPGAVAARVGRALRAAGESGGVLVAAGAGDGAPLFGRLRDAAVAPLLVAGGRGAWEARLREASLRRPGVVALLLAPAGDALRQLRALLPRLQAARALWDARATLLLLHPELTDGAPGEQRDAQRDLPGTNASQLNLRSKRGNSRNRLPTMNTSQSSLQREREWSLHYLLKTSTSRRSIQNEQEVSYCLSTMSTSHLKTQRQENDSPDHLSKMSDSRTIIQSEQGDSHNGLLRISACHLQFQYEASNQYIDPQLCIPRTNPLHRKSGKSRKFTQRVLWMTNLCQLLKYYAVLNATLISWVLTPNNVLISEENLISQSFPSFQGVPVRFLTTSLLPMFDNDVQFGWKTRGRDAHLIKMIATHSGMIWAHYFVPLTKIGSRHANGTWDGGMKILAEGKLDVFGIPIVRISYWQDAIEFLYPYSQSDYCFGVRAATLERNLPLQAFSVSTWGLIGFALLAVMLTLFMGECSFQAAWLETIRTFLGCGINSNGTFNMTLLLLTLNFFSMIVLTAFNGCLLSFLVVPRPGKNLETLEDVLETTDEIFVSESFKEFLRNYPETDVDYHLWKKASIFQTSQEMMEIAGKVAKDSRKALIYTTITLHFLQHLGITTVNGQSLLHIVPNCVVAPNHMSTIVRRGWPFAQRFSELIHRCLEAGVIQKLYQSTWNEYPELGMLKVVSRVGSSNQRRLSIPDFLWAFWVLFTGLTLSSFTFLSEKYMFHANL